MRLSWSNVLGGAFVLTFAGPASADVFFQDVADPFGTQACGGTGCWTNYVRVTDIDGDGDLDILFPNADGFFQKGQAEPLVVYLNDGAGHFTRSDQVFGNYSGWLRQIAVGDVDGDGDLDVYAPSAWGDTDRFFINQGGGLFVDQAATLLPGVASHAGAARFGDVDGDGDLDLIVGDGWAQSSPYVAHLYLNDGTGRMTDASAQLPTTKAGVDPIDFDLFDADGDFDLDLLINMHQGKNSLWLNDGAGNFTDVTANFPAPGPQSQFHYGPVACDVDGDGDLDVWIDNTGGDYTEQLLINDGKGAFTDETSARVSGNPSADDNGLACIDVDGDGDLDVAIMSLTDDERILINDGTGHFTLLPNGFTSISDGTLWFDFGDLDGDGRLDCVTAQGESSFIDRVYLGTSTMAPDTRPPGFRAVEQIASPVPIGASPAVRFAVFDDATTDEGPRLLKAYVRVTAPDGMHDVAATFMGGDLFRAVLPSVMSDATVTYAACATDRAGNDGCSQPKTYGVGQATAVGSGGAGGATASTGSPGSGASGVGGGVDGAAPGDEGGCGCRLPRRTGDARAMFAAVALAAAAARRRRRVARTRR